MRAAARYARFFYPVIFIFHLLAFPALAGKAERLCAALMAAKALDPLMDLPSVSDLTGELSQVLHAPAVAKQVGSFGEFNDRLRKWDVLSAVERAELVAFMRSVAPNHAELVQFRGKLARTQQILRNSEPL